MTFRTWLDGWTSTQPNRRARRAETRSPRQNPPGPKLVVERLEDRTVPAFLAPVAFAAGGNLHAVVAADFNNDTVLDLAVANSGDNTVNVLLGNGNGTFQPALASSTGYSPCSIAVGDFNADGNLDIATANLLDVSVLLGNGDGAFQGPNNIAIGYYPTSVAVGDFNGDGKLDLGVTSNYIYTDDYATYFTGYANVLLGNGAGSFSGPNSTSLGYGYQASAAVADFNGDSIDDFAAANSEYGYIDLLLGDSSGDLQWASYYTGYYADSLAAEDVNGDGNIDLVTANSSGNDVGVLLGDGAGGFGTAGNYATGSYPVSVVLGDFTGDGNIDVATTNYFSHDLSVLYGFGNGTFSTPVNSAAGLYPVGMAAGDFNGDLFPDVAVVNSNSNNFYVLINDQFWPPPSAPSVSINDVTVTEGNTGTTDATFTLSLSAGYDQDVIVHYETADGSAAAGIDYTGASGDVTFTAGQTSRIITVAVIGDRSPEYSEIFVVNLSAPVNATIAVGQGVGTIINDESTISINDVTVTEGNAGSVNAMFTVTLSFATDVAVTFHYATANGSATTGSDYTASSEDLTVPAGQTTQTFSIAVTGDRVAEATETFTVNLSAPVNATIAVGQGVGTIVDDEPSISIGDVTKAEGKKGQTTLFTFTVTLSAAYDQAVTMSFRTVNGTATTGDTDYIARSGTLTFAPGETTKTITIEVKGDSKRESNETFYLDLFGNSSNSLFTKNRGIGTIVNDD